MGKYVRQYLKSTSMDIWTITTLINCIFKPAMIIKYKKYESTSIELQPRFSDMPMVYSSDSVQFIYFYPLGHDHLYWHYRIYDGTAGNETFKFNYEINFRCNNLVYGNLKYHFNCNLRYKRRGFLKWIVTKLRGKFCYIWNVL